MPKGAAEWVLPVSHLRRISSSPGVLILGGVSIALDRSDALARVQQYEQLAFRHIAKMVALGHFDVIVTDRQYPFLSVALAEYGAQPLICDLDSVADETLASRKVTIVGRLQGGPRADQLTSMAVQSGSYIGADLSTAADFAYACGVLHVSLRRLHHDDGGARCGARFDVDGDLKTLVRETLQRPWGEVGVVANNDLASVRILTIREQTRLSFQRHHCRDELFVALTDDLAIELCGHDTGAPVHSGYVEPRTLSIPRGETVLVPRATWHRLKAPGQTARVLEIAFGVYDQVCDIDRLRDDYGRTGADGRV